MKAPNEAGAPSVSASVAGTEPPTVPVANVGPQASPTPLSSVSVWSVFGDRRAVVGRVEVGVGVAVAEHGAPGVESLCDGVPSGSLAIQPSRLVLWWYESAVPSGWAGLEVEHVQLRPERRLAVLDQQRVGRVDGSGKPAAGRSAPG